MIEPFLIIGVVATIRRLIVISAEAPNFIDEDKFEKAHARVGSAHRRSPGPWFHPGMAPARYRAAVESSHRRAVGAPRLGQRSHDRRPTRRAYGGLLQG